MEPYIGQVLLLPFNFAPRGWMACQGQLLPIAQNTALFALIGTQFGGNGTTTFALPNLASVPSVGGDALNYYIAVQGIFPSRD